MQRSMQQMQQQSMRQMQQIEQMMAEFRAEQNSGVKTEGTKISMGKSLESIRMQ